MNLILDFFLVLIALLCVYLGYKRGALATLLSFVSGILALVLAFFLAKPAGNFLNDRFLQKALSRPVSEKICELISSEDPSAAGLKNLLSAPPQELSDLLNAFGAKEGALAVNENDTAETVAENLVQPVSRMISYALSFLVLFLVFGLAIRLLIRFLRRFNHVPLIGPLNRVVGLVIGLFEGLVLAWVFCAAISLVIPYLQSLENPFLSQVSIDSTYLFRFLYSFDPLKLLFGFKL